MILHTRFTEETDYLSDDHVLYIDLINGHTGVSLFCKMYRTKLDLITDRVVDKSRIMTRYARDFAATVAELLDTHPRRSAVVDFEVMP